MRTILAGLLFSSAACTGSIDDTGDVDPNLPPSTDVKVVVKDRYTPQAGVRVIFQGADGTLLSDIATDANGAAEIAMASGNVTVIRTYPIPTNGTERKVPDVYTYVGVKAGDLLELGNEESNGAAGAIVVKVPEGANGTVKVSTPCGSGQGTAPNVAITVTDCPPMMDFYVVDGDNSSFYKKAPYSENVDLATEVLSGNLAATLAATNVPTGAQVNIEERVVAGMFALFSSGQKRVDQTPAQVNLPNVMGVEQLVLAQVQVTEGRQMVASRSSYSASPVLFDASANLIPYVSTVEYKPTGITWTETGTGTADAVLVRLNVTRGGTQMVDNEYTRTIIAPHGGATLAVPTLPDPLYNLGMMDQIAGTHGLVKVTGGYDKLRGKAFAVANPIEIAPSDGTATLSYSGNPPTRPAP